MRIFSWRLNIEWISKTFVISLLDIEKSFDIIWLHNHLINVFIFIINENVKLAMINEFLVFDNEFDNLIHIYLIHVSKIIVNENVIDKRFKKMMIWFLSLNTSIIEKTLRKKLMIEMNFDQYLKKNWRFWTLH